MGSKPVVSVSKQNSANEPRCFTNSRNSLSLCIVR